MARALTPYEEWLQAEKIVDGLVHNIQRIGQQLRKIQQSISENSEKLRQLRPELQGEAPISLKKLAAEHPETHAALMTPIEALDLPERADGVCKELARRARQRSGGSAGLPMAPTEDYLDDDGNWVAEPVRAHEIARLTEIELFKFRNFGRLSLAAVKGALARLGLCLGLKFQE